MSDPHNREVNKTARAKAKCFLNLMTSKSVVWFIHLLLDVCKPLRQLSVSFQEREACAADIHGTLKSTIAIVKKYNERCPYVNIQYLF